MFRVPVPQALADKPLPEAQLLTDATPIPEPIDPRPAPRPIYKQNRDTPPPDESGRDHSERRPGERSRRRKRVRAKETKIPPGVLVAGGILAFALIAGIIYAVISFSGEPVGPKPIVPNEEPPRPSGEGPVIPSGPSSFDLPKTWSMNSPSYGFRAAWPVPAGGGSSLGYTPIESLAVGYNGLKPNSWAYTDVTARILMSVSVIDLLDDGTLDADATIDRYVDKLRRKGPANLTVTTMSIGGLPGRQIAYVAEGDRSISRVTLKGTRLWTVSVVCPQQVPAEDGRVVRFLNSFQPL